MKIFNNFISSDVVKNTLVKGNGVARNYRMIQNQISREQTNSILSIPGMTGVEFSAGLGCNLAGFDAVSSAIIGAGAGLIAAIIGPIRHLITQYQFIKEGRKLKPEFSKIVNRLKSMKESHELRAKLQTSTSAAKEEIQKKIDKLAAQRKVDTYNQNLEYAKKIRNFDLAEKALAKLKEATNEYAALS